MPSYVCDYASSGRSRCRGCQLQISKNDIRIGPEMMGQYGPYTEWHHAACFNWRQITRIESVQGFQYMKDEDRKTLKALQTGEASGGESLRAWKPLPLTIQAPPRNSDVAAGAQVAPDANGGTSSATQDDGEDSQEPDSVCYGKAKMLVVGCRYYEGVLHNGEFATLHREPRNPYDANAIRIENLAGLQVGHLKRVFAAALAPILDDPSPVRPTVEAVVEAQSEYNLNLNVAIYGPEQFAEQTIKFLRGFGIHLIGGCCEANETEAGGTVISRDRSASVRSQADLDAMFDQLQSDLSKLDTAGVESSCKGIIQTTLLPHQKDGTAWMIARERSSVLPPFWNQVTERGQVVYLNTITQTSFPQPPAPVKGGILADDMGLGKTLQVFTVIVANPPAGVQYLRCNDAEAERDVPTVKKRTMIKPEDDEAIGRSPGKDQVGKVVLDLTEDDPMDSGSAKKSTSNSNEKAHWSKMKVKELKAELNLRGIRHAGCDKAALVNLLCGASSAVEQPSASATSVVGSLANTPLAACATGLPTSAATARGTLIVCPTSVLGNWADQASEHLAPGALSLHVYHGVGRTDAALDRYDVVVTTYGTLAAEYAASTACEGGGKRKKQDQAGLLGQIWHRVVLDEAHTIRNRKTKAYQACSVLRATYRWCVTGTPLQNKADDVQSLFGFLRAEPVCDPAVFTRAIGRPIRDGDSDGLARLRVLMRAVCLRRSKALLGSALPTKTVEVHRVRLLAAHREAYDVLFESARRVFDAALAASGAAVLGQYSSILECLLRLRQVCDATELVPPERLVTARQVLQELEALERASRAAAAAAGPGSSKGTVPAPAITAEEAARLFQKLKGALTAVEDNALGGSSDAAAGLFECAVCLGELGPEMARVLRKCGHCFCDYCLGRIAIQKHGGKTVCPMCRAPFSTEDILDSDKLQSIQEKTSKASEAAAASPNTSSALHTAAETVDKSSFQQTEAMTVTATEVQHQDGTAIPEVAAAETATEGASGAVLAPPAPPTRPVKIDSMIQQLKQAWASDPSQKAVIFSQFVGMLDVTQRELHREGITTGRIDGSMSSDERKRVIKRFGLDWPGASAAAAGEGGPAVLLVSLKAGGQGINLTRANWVFMLDLWWNAGVEEQAMDRVYRIGQVRPVTVVRYVCSDTVEERILQLQEKKKLLGQGALAKLSPEEVRAARLSDLRTIFS